MENKIFMETLNALIASGHEFSLDELCILHDKYGLYAVCKKGQLIGFEKGSD